MQSEPDPTEVDYPRCNVMLAAGVINGLEVRDLASGSQLVTFSLRAPGPESGATSLPIAYFDPPVWVYDLVDDTPVVVSGGVRRRFYRTASGVTGSRVEIVVHAMSKARERKRTQALVQRAHAAIDAIEVA